MAKTAKSRQWHAGVRKARRAGAKARTDKVKLKDNPYRHPVHHAAWVEGWKAAAKG